MPITSVDIENPRSSRGTVTINRGLLQGERGREVVLQATPADGYVFDRWEIQTSPITLPIFAQVIQRFETSFDACNASFVPGQSITLYSDGSRLYTDIEGRYPAQSGVWQTTTNQQYYNYNGTSIPTLQVCPQPEPAPSVGGGGGGGGIRNIDTRFVEDGTFSTSGEFDQTVGIDFGPNVQ